VAYQRIAAPNNMSAAFSLECVPLYFGMPEEWWSMRSHFPLRLLRANV
jgi:hypothetical protein